MTEFCSSSAKGIESVLLFIQAGYISMAFGQFVGAIMLTSGQSADLASGLTLMTFFVVITVFYWLTGRFPKSSSPKRIVKKHEVRQNETQE